MYLQMQLVHFNNANALRYAALYTVCRQKGHLSTLLQFISLSSGQRWRSIALPSATHTVSNVMSSFSSIARFCLGMMCKWCRVGCMRSSLSTEVALHCILSTLQPLACVRSRISSLALYSMSTVPSITKTTRIQRTEKRRKETRATITKSVFERKREHERKHQTASRALSVDDDVWRKEACDEALLRTASEWNGRWLTRFTNE